MSKHTPGPWLVVWGSSEPHIGASIIGDLPNDYTVAELLNHLPVKHQCEANAYLISAAPDMLEALRAIDTFWSEDRPSGPETKARSGFAELHETTRAVWRQIRAAIAKAEGR